MKEVKRGLRKDLGDVFDGGVWRGKWAFPRQVDVKDLGKAFKWDWAAIQGRSYEFI